MLEPNVESSWPPWSSRKSRLRRSVGGRWPGSGGAVTGGRPARPPTSAISQPRSAPEVSANRGGAGGRQAACLAQLVRPVRALPGELPAEVPVRGGVAVDRAEQVEVADDRGRPQVEDVPDGG